MPGYKAIKFLSILTSIVWCVVGLVILMGLWHGLTYLLVNVIGAGIFILLAYFFALRGRVSSELYKISKKDGEVLRLFLWTELILHVFSLFIGIVALSAVVSRVFGEGFTVFG